MKQFDTHNCFEKMDMDIHSKLTFESNIAMLCATILALCIIACCWMTPIIIRRCRERSNVQEHQPEVEVEMEQLERENNPNDNSYPLEDEQIQIQLNGENVQLDI